MKIKNNEAGFTLIELLTSVIVLVAVGAVVIGIISSSLRGTNKTNNIENIRQNGNYVLNQISKDITYAQPFDGVKTGLSKDYGITYDTACAFSLEPTPTPRTEYSIITVQSEEQLENDETTTYECTSSSELTELTANEMQLIDTDSISLEACSFTCIQAKATDIPILRISFRLAPKNSNGLVENSSPPIDFETSVAIRNYKR